MPKQKQKTHLMSKDVQFIIKVFVDLGYRGKKLDGIIKTLRALEGRE